MKKDATLDALKMAAKGLLFISETEAELAPFAWKNGSSLTPERLLKLSGRSVGKVGHLAEHRLGRPEHVKLLKHFDGGMTHQECVEQSRPGAGKADQEGGGSARARRKRLKLCRPVVRNALLVMAKPPPIVLSAPNPPVKILHRTVHHVGRGKCAFVAAKRVFDFGH